MLCLRLVARSFAIYQQPELLETIFHIFFNLHGRGSLLALVGVYMNERTKPCVFSVSDAQPCILHIAHCLRCFSPHGILQLANIEWGSKLPKRLNASGIISVPFYLFALRCTEELRRVLAAQLAGHAGAYEKGACCFATGAWRLLLSAWRL